MNTANTQDKWRETLQTIIPDEIKLNKVCKQIESAIKKAEQSGKETGKETKIAKLFKAMGQEVWEAKEMYNYTGLENNKKVWFEPELANKFRIVEGDNITYLQTVEKRNTSTNKTAILSKIEPGFPSNSFNYKFYEGEPYDKLFNNRPYFRTKEECQKFCDWLTVEQEKKDRIKLLHHASILQGLCTQYNKEINEIIRYLGEARNKDEAEIIKELTTQEK